METFVVWLEQKPQQKRATLLYLLAGVPAVLLIASAFVYPPASPVIGAITGLCLFLSVYGYWHSVVSPEKQQETDLKERFPIRTRRGLAGAGLAIWVILLLLVGQLLPGFIMGTLNVFVVACLYWFWRATPEEAAVALAEYEAAQEAKKNQKTLEQQETNPETDLEPQN